MEKEERNAKFERGEIMWARVVYPQWIQIRVEIVYYQFI